MVNKSDTGGIAVGAPDSEARLIEDIRYLEDVLEQKRGRLKFIQSGGWKAVNSRVRMAEEPKVIIRSTPRNVVS